MSDSFFEKVGGESFFTALVDDFYAGVANDPILRPMYPEQDLTAANRRLRLFLIQYWGGPTTYSDERGHPRLRMRHLPFTIDETARDHWLQHMMAAVDKRDLTEELRAELTRYLQATANHMMNAQ